MILHRGTVSGVAVIGCGYWGPNHIRCLSRLPGCRITAVDQDCERLASLRSQIPGVSTTPELNAIWDDPAVEAVIIATPAATHYELVRDALRAGKHVLCEKPLCTNEADAQELVDLARHGGLLLMVGHIFLFNPGIERLKQLIEGNRLGVLHYLSAVRTNLGPIRRDVGAALDLATHDISIFNWLLDAEPEWVSAVGGAFVNPDVDDLVTIALHYPGGCCATIQATWLHPRKTREITAVGSEKMAVWDDLDLSSVVVYSRGSSHLKQSGPVPNDAERHVSPAIEPLARQNQYFLDAILHNRLERSTGEFSLGVMRALDAVQQSLRNNGSPVQVRVPDRRRELQTYLW